MHGLHNCSESGDRGIRRRFLSALLATDRDDSIPVAYAIFAVFYSLFGTILYVAGPLVLALMPSYGAWDAGAAVRGESLIFATWGLIYGIFCRLAIALNIHSMAAITGAGSFAGAFARGFGRGSAFRGQHPVLRCILLIPMLAKRIVEGDLGSSMLLVMGGLQSLVSTAVALAGGPAGGIGAVLGGSAEAAVACVTAATRRRRWWRRQRQQRERNGQGRELGWQQRPTAKTAVRRRQLSRQL